MFSDKPALAEQLLENWPDGLIALDHYGNIAFCNAKMTQVLGWMPQAIIGKSAHDVLCSKAADYAHLPQDCPMCVGSKVDNIADYNNFEAWWISASGVYMNVDVRLILPEMQDLDVSKILMFSECSSGTISQFEARRLAMFAEFSPMPIVEISMPMSIEFANPSMTELMVDYGFNDEGIPCILPENLEALVDECVESGETLLNHEVEYNDKSFVWTFIPLIKNNAAFVQVFGLDVSELRQVQYQLEEAKNVAERASNAKSHFLANMSHEIRTPMNAIVGFTEILLRSKLNEKQVGYCQKIKISSSVLLEVINDILDFSKIEAGKLTLEQLPFNLIENIEVLADLFADKANDLGVHLVFDIDQRVPAVVVGDALRFKQILINLVSNALKFTSNGYVKISLQPIRVDDNDCRLRVEVEDTGKGIPEDKQTKLFAPFTQEDESTTRQYGGTGLGLSICRSLVELMQGSIGVRSQLGQGSVFFFEANFAVADSVSVLDRQMSHFRVDQHRNQVILLEANSVLRLSLRHQLQAYGLVLREFEQGVSLEDPVVWGQQCQYMLAVFCDEQPDHMQWLGEISQEIARLHIEYPRLMVMTKLSTSTDWAQVLQWPADRIIMSERPIKPSIIGRSILKKMQPNDGPKVVSLVHQNFNMVDKKNLHQLKILVVDDNAFNRELAAELLTDSGAKLDTAINGKIALEKATHNTFDIILMDIQMPIMDGFEASKLIKSHKPDQIIIALTANAVKGDRERFISAGFQDYICKPIDVEHLYDRLHFWSSKLDNTPSIRPDVMTEASNSQITTNAAVLQSQALIAAPATLNVDTMPVEFRGLQVAKALKMVGDKKSLYFKLLKMFTHNYANTREDLLLSLEVKDVITAGRLVHTIKGSAASLGADDLSGLASELERAVMNDSEQMQDLLNDFCLQLGSVIHAMDQLFDEYHHLSVDTKPATK